MAEKRKRRKVNIPKDETKAARFVRVVTPRIVKAVKSISVVGYCAGSTYEYTPKQTQQIMGVLIDAVDAVNSKFEAKAEPEGVFEFED